MHPFYTDLEYLIKKMSGCKNNLENFSITKVSKHILWDYSMSTIYQFDDIKVWCMERQKLHEKVLWIFKSMQLR